MTFRDICGQLHTQEYKATQKAIGQMDISYKDVKMSWMCFGWMPKRGIYGNAGLHKSHFKAKIFI